MWAKKKEKRKKQISKWGATGGHSPPSKLNIAPPARHAKRAERGGNNARTNRAPHQRPNTPHALARGFFLSHLRKNERSEALFLSDILPKLPPRSRHIIATLYALTPRARVMLFLFLSQAHATLLFCLSQARLTFFLLPPHICLAGGTDSREDPATFFGRGDRLPASEAPPPRSTPSSEEGEPTNIFI